MNKIEQKKAEIKKLETKIKKLETEIKMREEIRGDTIISGILNTANK